MSRVTIKCVIHHPGKETKRDFWVAIICDVLNTINNGTDIFTRDLNIYLYNLYKCIKIQQKFPKFIKTIRKLLLKHLEIQYALQCSIF